MHLHLTDYVLWIATPLVQMGVLIAMVRRGLHRDYPYFFNYTVLQVVSVPVLYIIYTRSYPVFFYAYYVNIALSVLISFAVLQEIFKDAFRPYEALRDLSVILFRWSALVVLLVGVMVAINTNQAKSENGAIVDAILLAERSVRLMQCGLVFFLLLFSEYLGISRRSLLFGISLGFGFFGAINMLVATGMTHRGVLHQSTLRQINSGAYLIAIAIWLGYALAAAPSESKVGEAVARSKDWNSALEDARVQPGADSLLDTMDRTVERLLYPREESKINISTGHS